MVELQPESALPSGMDIACIRVQATVGYAGQLQETQMGVRNRCFRRHVRPQDGDICERGTQVAAVYQEGFTSHEQEQQCPLLVIRVQWNTQVGNLPRGRV